MKPGNVVSIRVNPTDSMAVVDLLEVSGLRVSGMSFPAMVSLALSSCLEGLRQQGVIPERDGFEYSAMMEGIIGVGNHARKVEVTKVMNTLGSDFKPKAPPTKMPRFLREPVSQNGTRDDEPAAAPAEEVVSLEVRQARTRLAELNAKKELYDDGHPGIVWSAGDQKEFDDLVKVVYG